MTNILPSSLSEHDLLAETKRAAAVERSATAALLALLAEVEWRGSHLRLGFNSLFAYCTRALHLSESAAYSRTTAARATQRFPILLSFIEEGALSLTTVGLLSPHLTDENHASLFEAARHKSKRDVERLVAALHPQPDIAPSIRALPVQKVMAGLPIGLSLEPAVAAPGSLSAPPVGDSRMPTPSEAPRRPSVVAPLAPRRYLIRMTVGQETHDKLQRARDLLRHVIPDGDPAAIVDRALTILLQQTERTKLGSLARPRTSRRSDDRNSSEGRHVPASVRRLVWARDQGRCAFMGSERRCAETGGLEFHHVVPFASSGPATVENLQLRCRAHNTFEAAETFGDWRLKAQVTSSASALTPSGRS